MRRLFKWTCSALAATFCVGLFAHAAVQNQEGFRYSAEISPMDEKSYTALRLTPEILSKVQPNLADLLLVSGGNPVPYFLNTHETTRQSTNTTYDMTPKDSYLKDDFQYLEYTFSEIPAEDRFATSLHVESSGQFVKEVALYGSYDGLRWTTVQEDTLYQVDSSQKLSISLDSKQKYTWYRFVLSGNQEPLVVTRAWAEYNTQTVSQALFTEEVTPAFSARTEDSTTILSLSGMKNLSLAGITLETQNIFKRRVTVADRDKTLYNLPFQEQHYKDLSIDMNGYHVRENQLELRIENEDDAPIQIDSVRATYLAYDLVFQRTDKPVMLYFGNNNISAAPVYDIDSYKEHILAEGYGESSIGEITQLLDELPAESAQKDYTLLFNVVVVAVALLLAFLLIVRLKRVK